MAIEYIKGDLFTANQSKILLQACNCRRRWGAVLPRASLRSIQNRI